MELTYGKGVDVCLEMAGPPSSINNAISAVRRGGQVVLFGIKDGNLTIPDYSRLVTRGITIHSVIGRRIFETWQISQRVLSKKSNGIQNQIWETILNSGSDTLIPLSSFNPRDFEEKMEKFPKIILSMDK